CSSRGRTASNGPSPTARGQAEAAFGRFTLEGSPGYDAGVPASSKLVWLEIVLIALFGTISVGLPWFIEVGLPWLLDEQGNGATSIREPSREQLELELDVAGPRDAVALIDQQLTAVRAAAVESGVAARRNASKA